MYLDLLDTERKLFATNRRRRFTYHEFIKSEFWEAQKALWFEKRKNKCARCGSTKSINLHHKRYPTGTTKRKRYLTLRPNDFVALCNSCHFTFHDQYGVSQNMQRNTVRFMKQVRRARGLN